MIQLIRVYRDGLVIHAESYDHDEIAPDHRHPYERCRCMPSAIWQTRLSQLRDQFKDCKVTVDPIYLSREE